MRIDGTNLQAQAKIPFGGMSKTDAVSRNLQNQIDRTKQELQELSADKDLSLEEKMKKRQELQKQLSDLTVQLRQHQMELRRQEQKKRSDSVDDLTGSSERQRAGRKEKGGVRAGMSSEGMRALISADSALSQAGVSGRVSGDMEGRAGVLESEIRLDGGRGSSTEQKEQELAEVKEAAYRAQSAQMGMLRDADQAAKEAARAGKEEARSDGRSSRADESEQTVSREEGEERFVEDAAAPWRTGTYAPVDIRL